MMYDFLNCASYVSMANITGYKGLSSIFVAEVNSLTFLFLPLST